MKNFLLRPQILVIGIVRSFSRDTRRFASRERAARRFFGPFIAKPLTPRAAHRQFAETGCGSFRTIRELDLDHS
jgi:hypothetical protein